MSTLRARGAYQLAQVVGIGVEGVLAKAEFELAIGQESGGL